MQGNEWTSYMNLRGTQEEEGKDKIYREMAGMPKQNCPSSPFFSQTDEDRQAETGRIMVGISSSHVCFPSFLSLSSVGGRV